MTEPGMHPEVTPLDNAFRMLRERWWVLVLCVVLGAALFLGRALTQEKEYTAAATVLLQPSSLTTLIDPNGRAGADPEREAATSLLLVRANDVAELVKRELRSPLSVGDLIARVDVANRVGADLLDITATEDAPQKAADLANAFAEQFVAFRRENDRVLIEAGETTLRRQLAALDPDETVERRELEETLQQIQALSAVATGDAEVVSLAEAPEQASAPLPKRSLASGIVLGGGFGFLLVVGLHVLDRRLRRTEDFELLFDAPVLATVPSSAAGRALTQDPGALEAYRILTGALTRLDPGCRVVVVTSATPGEGKTAVAVGLARAAALGGRRVVLVEADLRRPTIATELGLQGPARGLVTALVGGEPVPGLLVPILPGLATLKALPAGPVPPNAPELLRSQGMRDLLAGLQRGSDLVVVDAPALLPVADAQVLLDLPEVTTCLVVARAGVAAEPEVVRTRETLARYADLSVGIVVTGASG